MLERQQEENCVCESGSKGKDDSPDSTELI
jgi:hypothetical protein